VRSITKKVSGQEVVFGPGVHLENFPAVKGLRLHKVDLTNATLRGVWLTGAKMRHANFTGADCRGMSLNWADLRYANFTRADLRGCVLGEADLRHATLGGPSGQAANVHEVVFYKARLDYADLRGCDLRHSFAFPNESMRTANIDAARVVEVVMRPMDPCEWEISPSGHARRPWDYVARIAAAQGLDQDLVKMFYDDHPGATTDEVVRLASALQRATQSA